MAPRLKIISKHGVGLDNIDLDAAKEFGIKVCYAAGSNTVAVAELACAMIMALARGLVINTQEIAAGRWNRQRGIELTGSTLGVVGTGAIGREVIRRMRAFGMKILAYDSFPDTKLISTIGGRYVELEELLCCSDFVSLHLPLTEDTRNLIDEQQIDKMKQGAYLINTARGGIVNEAALYKALKTGKIAGAGIDTFVDEPPFSSPLTKLNNVVMTPHIGGYTKEAIDKMSRAAAANIVQHIMEMKGLKSE
jgi:D-3-phosphoglycerate dehydrogenase